MTLKHGRYFSSQSKAPLSSTDENKDPNVSANALRVVLDCSSEPVLKKYSVCTLAPHVGQVYTLDTISKNFFFYKNTIVCGFLIWHIWNAIVVSNKCDLHILIGIFLRL